LAAGSFWGPLFWRKPRAHLPAQHAQRKEADNVCPLSPSVAYGAQLCLELTGLAALDVAAARLLADVTFEQRCFLGRIAMRRLRNWLLALVACGAAALAPPALAQPAGLNVGRDCQVVRTCNFGRSGAYRGCLSTFTCRVCRFVPARCVVDGAQRVCQRMRCTWGG